MTSLPNRRKLVWPLLALLIGMSGLHHLVGGTDDTRRSARYPGLLAELIRLWPRSQMKLCKRSRKLVDQFFEQSTQRGLQ